MNTWKINGYTIEYMEDIHCYLAEGVILPSITTLLKYEFSAKYYGLPSEILKRAAEKGTYMHEAIQRYEEEGYETSLQELDGYIKLKNEYKWECIGNELPIILFIENKPVACGRLDMVYKINNQLGIMDFKRTSKLDIDYVSMQLNLYRLAYQQTYKETIKELKVCHLRDKKHKIVEIPIEEEKSLEMVKKGLEIYYAEI